MLPSIALAAQDAVTGSTIGEEWAAELEASVQRNGTFSKFAVAYIPFNPPPFFWLYSCSRCRFWKEPNGCTLVDGWIARGGWCAIWYPAEGKPPFTWIADGLADLPSWIAEAPQVLAKWFDTGFPPKELWMLGGQEEQPGG